VARFVGADRGLKRLALRRLDEIELPPPPNDGRKRPESTADTTLRDALSAMLTAGSNDLIVLAANGEPIGHLTFDVVSRLLSSRGDEVPA
jgi:osmoprotectant transport system ATP-binding protein